MPSRPKPDANPGTSVLVVPLTLGPATRETTAFGRFFLRLAFAKPERPSPRRTPEEQHKRSQADQRERDTPAGLAGRPGQVPAEADHDERDDDSG